MTTPTDPNLLTPFSIQTNANETPGQTTPLKLFPSFGQETFDRLVTLIATDEAEQTTVRQYLLRFIHHVGAKQFADFKVLKEDDVIPLFNGDVGPFTRLVPKKRLLYVVAYSRHESTLAPTVTMDDIIATVDTSIHLDSTDKSTSSSITSDERKTVPTLKKFDGYDENWFVWSETVLHTLGTAGLARYLTDATAGASQPGVAEAVFYALKGSLFGGAAHHMVQSLVDKKSFNPHTLWQDLEAHYNNRLNKDNVVLYELKRLFQLRLNPGDAPTSFISDFTDCLQRLRKNGAKVADDNDTLRALLLVAIQDEAYETVRDAIVENPTKTAADFLVSLREKDTSLQLKDGAKGISGDTLPHRNRRVSFHDTPTKGSKYGQKTSSGSWNIPLFPSSWKAAVGDGFWKHMLSWKTAAIRKAFDQERLNKEFNVLIEDFTPGSKRKSRRAAKQDSPNGSESKEATDKETNTDSKSDDSPLKRRRVMLPNRSRIISEHGV